MVQRFLHILRTHKLLIVVFFCALLIRTYSLASVPNGFHKDEVANTTIGRFILENGTDIYGNPWPLLYVDKFGDYPPVLPMYFSGLASYIFGLNEFASRFPSALMGSLGVIAIYMLVRLFTNKATALASAILLTLLPWHVVLSRSSSEGIFGLTTSIFGMYMLFTGIQQENRKNIGIAAVLFALTYILYPSFRLLVPIILLPTPFLFGKTPYMKRTLIGLLIGFIALTGVISSTTWGKGRFVQTSLFSNETDARVIQNDLKILQDDDGNHSQLPITGVRVFHNKAVAYGQRLIEQYLSYYSPHFLFVKGGLPQRYAVPHLGLMYFTLIIFLASFLYAHKNTISKNTYLYFLYLLLVSSIPAAITVDDWPNMHRSIFMIIPLVVFSAMGVINLYQIVSSSKRLIKIALFGIIGFICAVEIIFASHNYYAHAGAVDSYTRDDGTLSLTTYIADNKNNYKNVLVPSQNWTAIYYLFHTKDFNKSYAEKFGLRFTIDAIDTVRFYEKMCLDEFDINNPNEFTNVYHVTLPTLVVLDGSCKPHDRLNHISTIYRRDGSPAYLLYNASIPAKK